MGQRLGQAGQPEDTEEKHECWSRGWRRAWSGGKGGASDSRSGEARAGIIGSLGEHSAVLPLSSNPPECTASSALQETSPARLRAVQV